MMFINTIKICQEFLKNIKSRDGCKEFGSDGYSKFVERFRNINKLFESNSERDNFQLEAFEAWNSILHCYKIILERCIGAIIVVGVSAEENYSFKMNSNINTIEDTENRKNNTDAEIFYCIYSIIKELSLILEKMRSFLEKNNGFICKSSTSGLSIALMLVKCLTYRKKLSNVDLIEKLQLISLSCLSLLFKTYKLEFTESWDIILFPENIQGICSYQINKVERKLAPNFFKRKDVPFLIYFLFSDISKVRINTIICIQSIFSAQISRIGSMTHFLSSKTPNCLQDTSAFSLLNNIVNLTNSMLVFGNMFFSSNESDIDTKITLIKAFSHIVSSTPPLFWTNNFVCKNISFLNSLSLILNNGVNDPGLIIPSLQLFSNIVNLNKNCELEEELAENYHIPLDHILEFNIYIIDADNQNNVFYDFSNNGKSSIRMINIVTESMNFFFKLILHAPLLIFRPKFSVYNIDKGNQLFSLIRIINYYITGMERTDRTIFIKAIRVAYNLLDMYRNLSFKSELCDSQIYCTILNLNPFTETFKRGKHTSIENNEKLHSVILELAISFVNYMFIVNPHMFYSININSNIDILCEVFNVFSLLNPVLIETVYFKSCLNEHGTYLDFIFCLLERNLNDKLFPCIIQNILCFCINSQTPTKSFRTFQNFENSLVEKLFSLIENLHTGSFKESILVSINKAIIFISDYHEKKNGSIVCSFYNSRQNLNLLNPLEDFSGLETETNCALDWRSLIYKYRSFLVELDKNESKPNNILRTSEIIRAFGHLSRLMNFSMRDYNLLLWLLQLLYEHIFKTCVSSFKINKVKWNSIYAIGFLFQNLSFNKMIIELFFSNDNKLKELLYIFTRVWNGLCNTVMNNSELIKVRINALRSITMYNSSANDKNSFKIPHFILLITWEMYFYAKRNENINQLPLNQDNTTYHQRYNNSWKSCLFKLSTTLHSDTLYHLKNSSVLLSNKEREKLETYLTEFNETNTQ